MFLTYNGVNLSLTSIDRVNRDTILSDDGTTVVCVETTLSVSGVYHPPIGGVPQLGGTSVSGRKRNRGRLTTQPATPRQTVRGSDPGGGPGVSTAPFQNSAVPKLDALEEGDSGVSGSLSQPSGPANSLQVNFLGAPGIPAAPQTSGSNPLTPTSCSLPSPGSEGWAGPINTDRELELRLRVPRKKLIVWAFDSANNPIIWIESPRRSAPSDARTGPIVLNSSIKGGPNANTFFVSLDIRTWLTPCEDGSDRPILSHRWQMSHIEDEDHYLTRQVRGSVVFDVGNMLEAGQNPDWFRRQLFHPIPLGFKRTIGEITLTPDGSTLDYSYADTDQRVVFDAWNTGAINMELQEYVQYHNPWRGFS